MTLISRIPVIFDTDPGVDDIIALLFALSSPELEILAIIVSYGNTDLDSAYANVLKSYQAIRRHLDLHPHDAIRFPNFFNAIKTIICRGSDGPLEGALHSATYFHGRDGLGEINERHPDLNITSIPEQLEYSKESGTEVALRLLRERETRSVTYIAIGPLTNLAKMMRRDSELVATHVGRIICMGGALDVPGNTSPVAEFNFFADPYAARELLSPETPYAFPFPLDRFLLLPLDITTPHQLPFQMYKERVDSSFDSPELSQIPITHFTSAFLSHTRRIMKQFGSDAMQLHDIVAVWCATQNPPTMKETYATGWKAARRIFDIECTGEITRGMVVVDRREDPYYAPGANRAEVQAELERASHGYKDSVVLPAPVEVESPPSKDKNSRGVWCITETPGSEALLEILFKKGLGGI